MRIAVLGAAGAMAGVVLQAAHFTEELLTGFHQQFPAILGLAAWSPGLFTAFNLAWLAGWVMSIAALRRWPKTATFPLWFLGLAAVVNGLAHPLLSAATADYFPGTWSSLFLAIAGVYLLRELAAATRATAATEAARSSRAASVVRSRPRRARARVAATTARAPAPRPPAAATRAAATADDRRATHRSAVGRARSRAHRTGCRPRLPVPRRVGVSPGRRRDVTARRGGEHLVRAGLARDSSRDPRAARVALLPAEGCRARSVSRAARRPARRGAVSRRRRDQRTMRDRATGRRRSRGRPASRPPASSGN